MSNWEELGLDGEIVEEFVSEAEAGLDKLRPTILHLEEEGYEGVDAIFRWVHTVKGTSGFLNLSELQSFAHRFENYLQKLKAGKINLTHNLINKATEGVELLEDALTNLRKKQIELSDDYERFVKDLPLDSTHPDQKESIDKVLERLSVIVSTLEDKKNSFVDKGTPTEILDAISGLEGYLKRIEDFEVQVVVKALTLSSVIGPDGKNLTDSVRSVLEAMEDVVLVGTAAKSLTSSFVNSASELVHVSLFPTEEKKVFDWSLLAELIDLMPEIVKDFWQKFWIDGLEKHASITYYKADDLTRKFSPQVEQTPENDLPVAETDGSTELEKQETKQDETIRVDSNYLERFTRRTEALVMNRNYMENLGLELKKHVPANVSMEFREGIDDLENNIEELEKYLFRVRSTHLSELFERIPRMVRKLEKDLGKSVRVLTKGETIEVDRTVVNVLSDIFVHVVRNSIDHGIETPEVRKMAGKQETGTISIIAKKDEDWINIEISDDGRGINHEKVIKKALEKGLASPDKDYSMDEIAKFLLEPGFSTADTVTSVSGRGVGMDVVASSIRNQGGKVTITSEWEQGTTIRLSFPTRKGSLTRDVLLVELDRRIYAVNHDCLREIIDANGIRKNISKAGFFCHRNQLINMADLSRVLHNGQSTDKTFNNGRLLILEDQIGNCVAARVDKVLNKMQVVIKGFSHDFLKNNDLFEGTVVIGLGQPILVLNLKNASVLTG